MNRMLLAVCFAAVVWSAQAKIVVYEVVYKDTFWYSQNAGPVVDEKEVSYSLLLLDVNPETGLVNEGYHYAYGPNYENGKKVDGVWINGPYGFTPYNLIMSSIDGKNCVVSLWWNSSMVGKLKNGILYKAKGFRTRNSISNYYIFEIGAGTTALKTNNKLTKLIAAAVEGGGALDEEGFSIAEEYLAKKGYILD